MRLIQPEAEDAKCEEAAFRQLLAEMLCLEWGARAVGADLAPLAPPHEPWPVVRLPPRTPQGKGVDIHYRPAVGVVYCTGAAAADLEAFAERLAAALRAAGDAHLLGARAIAVTPSVVLRQSGRAAAGTKLSRLRRVAEGSAFPRGVGGPLAAGAKAVPARRLAVSRSAEPPPHYSAAAAFLWVVKPAHTAFLDQFDTICAANASVAGLIYDGAAAFRGPAGRELDLPREADLKEGAAGRHVPGLRDWQDARDAAASEARRANNLGV